MATEAELLQNAVIRDVLLAREQIDFDQVWEAGDVATGYMSLIDLAARARVAVTPGQAIPAGGPYLPENVLPAWIVDGILGGTVGLPAGGNVATDAIFDAKGDLVVGSGPNASARVAAGPDYSELVADSAQAAGVRWRAATQFNVKDYGAVGDGVTDDQAAIQAAITAAIGAGGSVFFPRGDYLIGSTLTAANADGFVMHGVGGGTSGGFGSRLIWGGTAASPLLLLQDIGRGELANLQIKSTALTPMLVGVQIENGSGVLYTSTHNLFRNVSVDGGSAGGLLKAGFYLAQGAGGDANNDFMVFENCAVLNYDNCGWLIYHSQSKHHIFINCDARAASGNAAGVGVSSGRDVHAGTNSIGGGFNWYGGTMSHNHGSDFYVSTPNDSVIIEGLDSENSGRLCYVGGPTSVRMPLNIRGNRWSDTGNLNADGYAVSCGHPGPVVIDGNRFEASAAKAVKMLVSGGGSGASNTPAMLEFSNNYIETNLTAIEGMIGIGGTGLGMWSAWNNTALNRTGSVVTRLPDRIPRTDNPISMAGGSPSTHQLPGPILVNTGGINRTITLPTAVGWPGLRATVVKTDAAVNTVTVDANGSETIDGQLTYVLSRQYEAVEIVSDGANWLVTQQDVPSQLVRAANGQVFGMGYLAELTTVAAAATTTTTIQIPANAVVLGVSARVTVAIPTAATFDVGVSGAATRYGAALSTALNTTNPGTQDGTRYYAAATAILITPNLTPAANTGRVRVTVHYYSITPATS